MSEIEREPDDGVLEEEDDAADEPYPVEQWIPHPKSDWAEWLDRPEPKYLDDLSPEDRAEAEKKIAERTVGKETAD